MRGEPTAARRGAAASTRRTRSCGRRRWRRPRAQRARADVRGIERLRAERCVRPTQRLGGKRPAEVEGLLATLESQLESARAIQLARDQWELRAPRRPPLPARRDDAAAYHQSQHRRARGRARPGRDRRRRACRRSSSAGVGRARGWIGSRRPSTCSPSTRSSAVPGRWPSRRSRCGSRPPPATTQRAPSRPRRRRPAR